MTDARLDALQGQIEAMSMAICALMQTIQPVMATQAAMSLEDALEKLASQDSERGTSAIQSTSREAIVRLYCTVLETFAQTDV